MGIVIKVENLGKKYIISHQQERYSALRDIMANTAKKAVKKVIGKSEILPKKEEFWALRNIDFEVNQGDRIGIIGRNGAGKSTLLKLLSKITEPTEGKIKIKGKVASLLEVGTGFHPELTGRENILLNGAILGMSKKEILKKMDDIVEFSGVEKFLDTPVKRYSSGMHVRLAFAVAANLETEILLVDEVLAVGDAGFQKKCLGKMDDLSKKEGRTVLFVSHNMGAIRHLCNRALLLNKGQVIKDSLNVREVINSYLSGDDNLTDTSEWINHDDEFYNQYIKLFRVFASDLKGIKLQMPVTGNDNIWINIELEIKEYDPALQIGYALFNSEGELIYWSFHTDESKNISKTTLGGKNIFRSKISRRFLNEGTYIVEIGASLYSRFWIMEPSVNSPNITINVRGDLSDSPYWVTKRPGILAPTNEWQIIKL